MPRYQINQIYGDGNVDDVPNDSAQCNFEERLEKDSENDEKNHSVLIALFVGLVCEVCKSGRCCETDKYKKAVWKISQA